MQTFDEAARSHFDEHGYVILEDVLTGEETAFLRELVMKLAEWEREQGSAHIYNDNKCQRIWNLLNKHEAFQEVIQRPIVIDAVSQLYNDSFLLKSWTANIVGPGSERGNLHIDSHLPHDFPLPPMMMESNTMWPLDDFTEHNGATIILPGSHRSGKRPGPGDDQREDLIKIIAPKGSVIITNGYLWHQSGKNETDRERVVLLGYFAPRYVRSMAMQEDYHQVIDHEKIAAFPPLLRKMICTGHGVNPGALQKPPQFA